MADTGSPWNLPYPVPSDLVKDGADAIKDLAEAAATGLSSIPVIAGIGSNVVQAVKTDTFSTTSTTYTNVTGLSVTITPTSNTAKILIIAMINQSDWAQGSMAQIVGGNAGTFIGDAASSRVRAATYFNGGGSVADEQARIVANSYTYLDSPATTSPVTYSVQLRSGGSATGATAYINRSHADTNAATMARVPSSITAIEVKP
jgi:hypothetical protein